MFASLYTKPMLTTEIRASSHIHTGAGHPLSHSTPPNGILTSTRDVRLEHFSDAVRVASPRITPGLDLPG
jgi:hypothetical protein